MELAETIGQSSEILFAFAKIGVLILLLGFIFFAIIVVRQVQLMTDTLDVAFDKFATFISYVFLVFAVLIFIFAFVAL